MYQKLEKPYLWYSSHYSEFFTHLGDEQFFASTDIEGIGTSLRRIGARCWGIEGQHYLFEKGGAVVAPSPIILWEDN